MQNERSKHQKATVYSFDHFPMSFLQYFYFLFFCAQCRSVTPTCINQSPVIGTVCDARSFRSPMTNLPPDSMHLLPAWITVVRQALHNLKACLTCWGASLKFINLGLKRVPRGSSAIWVFAFNTIKDKRANCESININLMSRYCHSKVFESLLY